MVIYLRHPQHGNKVAICHTEAEYDEKNGWERYNLGMLLTPSEAAPVVLAQIDAPKLGEVEIDVLRELWTEKFGKAPHHKKSAATLRKELEDGNCR